VAARAVEWLQQVDRARPFCAWIGFGGPHTPWDAPGHYATIYDPADVPDPIPAPEPPDWLPAHARERMLTGRDERFTPEVSRRRAAAACLRQVLASAGAGRGRALARCRLLRSAAHGDGPRQPL